MKLSKYLSVCKPIVLTEYRSFDYDRSSRTVKILFEFRIELFYFVNKNFNFCVNRPYLHE